MTVVAPSGRTVRDVISVAAVALETHAQLHAERAYPPWHTAAILREWCAPGLDPEHRWAHWTELVDAVRVRDGLRDGSLHWSQTHPTLPPGVDRQQAAVDDADNRVVDALAALVRGAR